MDRGAVPVSLHEALMAEAREYRFPVSGSVDIKKAVDSGQFQTHLERYDRWLAAGFAGTMDYLSRGRDRRADPTVVFPEAQSVFCVAVPYSAQALGASVPANGPRYARYLRGSDYHTDIASTLDRILDSVSRKRVLAGHETLRWKTCVDTSAVLERSWAAMAGLGWIGKNTLLIHPKLGSYFFIGLVLLDQETGQSPSLSPDLCGHCEKCLKSCPTQAFHEPHTLDSNRCISYLTLEDRKGETEFVGDKKQFGTWVAGCDICQEVCPFNRKAEKTAQFCLPDPALPLDWRTLILETKTEYRKRIPQSSLSRVKSGHFSRNLAVAFRNAIDQGAITHSNEMDHLIQAVKVRIETEEDLVALREWKKTWNRLEAWSVLNLKIETRTEQSEPYRLTQNTM